MEAWGGVGCPRFAHPLVFPSEPARHAVSARAAPPVRGRRLVAEQAAGAALEAPRPRPAQLQRVVDAASNQEADTRQSDEPRNRVRSQRALSRVAVRRRPRHAQHSQHMHECSTDRSDDTHREAPFRSDGDGATVADSECGAITGGGRGGGGRCRKWGLSRKWRGRCRWQGRREGWGGLCRQRYVLLYPLLSMPVPASGRHESSVAHMQTSSFWTEIRPPTHSGSSRVLAMQYSADSSKLPPEICGVSGCIRLRFVQMPVATSTHGGKGVAGGGDGGCGAELRAATEGGAVVGPIVSVVVRLLSMPVPAAGWHGRTCKPPRSGPRSAHAHTSSRQPPGFCNMRPNAHTLRFRVDW